MPRMGVGPVGAGPLVWKHRHRLFPFLSCRPSGLYRPLFALCVDSAVVTAAAVAAAAGMSVAGIAVCAALCPGKRPDLLRVGRAVAVTIYIGADLCVRIVPRISPFDNLPA